MKLIYVICLALQLLTVNGNQTEHGEEGPKLSCGVISDKTVPCSLSQSHPWMWVVEVFAGQTIEIVLQDVSTHPCFCNWESSEDSSKPTLTGQLREGDFVFLFQATDRHAGLATIHCRNGSTDSTNRTDISFNLIVKPTKRPSKPYFSLIKNELGKAHNFTCKSEGSPVPDIRWYKDIHKINVISKNIMSKNGPNSVESHLYSYEHRKTFVMCCASNQLGEECSLLYDYDLDRADSSPVVEMIRGQTVLLRCRYTRFSKYFDWFFNGSKIDQDLDMSYTYSKYLRLNKSDLVTSVYTCRDMEKNKKISATINVLEKGYINVLELNEVNNITANEKSGFCVNTTVHSFPLADCNWVTQTGKRIKCQGEENVFEGKSTYKLCSQEPGAYQLHLENRYTCVTKNVSLCITESPTFKLSHNDSSVTCMTRSTQPYNLTWKACQLSDYECDNSEPPFLEKQPMELTSSEQYCHQTIVSSIPHEHVQGFVLYCCLQNRADRQCSNPIAIEKSELPAQVIKDPAKDSTFLLGVITILVAILILVTTLLCYFIKKKKPVYQSQLQMIQMVGPADNDYIYIDFKDFKYDQKWEFPRENLELGKELGSGAFGKVVQATAYGISKPGVSLQVAVKMLKDKHQAVEREALMSELKMLTYIGHHDNIVNLLGACTHSGPTYLIFQYCCHGDLLNYLKNNRQHFHKSLADALTKDRFISLYHNSQPKQNNSDYQHPVSPYVPMSPVNHQDFEALLSLNPPSLDIVEADGGREEMEEMLDDLEDVQEEDLQVLTYGDLLSFSYQAAKGMEFLSSKNCIHRDLAARNVLVTRGQLVKIGDFGLARDIDNDSNYVVRGNARLPVKWMAPESIFTGMYTMQSDVWAYGILLWEIFSLGVTPYPGMKVDTHFYSLIERGFQMEQPYYSSESVYRMMCCCWALEPQDRPCFSELVLFMEKELSDMEEKIYLNVEEQNNNNAVYQNIAGKDPEQTASQMGEKAEEASDPCGGEI